MWQFEEYDLPADENEYKEYIVQDGDETGHAVL
jgi:hypothetical protein